MSSLWEPLDGRRSGMIGVAVASCVSITSIILLLAISGATLRAYHRIPAFDRQGGGETRALKFLTSDYFPLFVNLLVCDLVQGLGFGLNVEWLARNSYPLAPSPGCTTQAIFIQFGDLGSAFGSLLIGIHITLIFVAGRKVSRKQIYGAISLQWTLVLFMTLVGPLALDRPGDPFYAWAGGWCWISESYDSMRLFLHYLWVFTVASINLVLYAVIVWTISRANRHEPEPGARRKPPVVMLAFPIVYICTIVPLSSFRIAAMAGQQWNIHVQLATGAVFCLNGFVNCVLYATTRKLVKIEKKQLSSGAWTIGRGGPSKVSPAAAISVHTTRRVSFSGSSGLDGSGLGWGYNEGDQEYELRAKGKDGHAGV